MEHRTAVLLAAAVLALAASCARFPELDETVDEDARRAPYPALIPLEGLAAPGAAPRATAPATEALEARAARLRARAGRIRGDVIDTETRRRMEAGVE
ncbi:MAG: hypothetical protein RI571_13805 [Roseovarius sp.]|nr:hypothetical protein [Roseovarius sp.]